MQNDILEAISSLDNKINETNEIDFESLINWLDENLNTQEIEVENVFSSEIPEIESIESLVSNLDIDTLWESNSSTQENWILEAKLIEDSEATHMAKIVHDIPVVSFVHIEQEIDAWLKKELEDINKQRKHRRIAAFLSDKAKFMANYVMVSTLVFVVLLWWVNYSAYSKIAYDFINPDNLKNSSKEILSVIDNSKIKVFADEDTNSLWKDQQEELQEKLSKDNVQLRDTYFSPKKLVPLKSNVDLSVEVMPYENRIIIPKIWKNIPLVDVDTRRSDMSFENLENIFMTELEKWIVRYPGTAKPWENGVSFIFWHSSNYPWMKWDYNDVFALLDNLTFWDEIIVYYNQKKYTYVMKEKKVIKPGNIKIIDRDPTKKELSLMTCWPIWTSLNRLIAFAELKEETKTDK